MGPVGKVVRVQDRHPVSDLAVGDPESNICQAVELGGQRGFDLGDVVQLPRWRVEVEECRLPGVVYG